MNRPASRFELDSRAADALLADAGSARVAGPWRAAWLRLRRDRAAFAALLFLGSVAVVSLLAPLWPLPSPVALALQDEPAPPTAPWNAFLVPGFSAEYWELSAADRALVALRQWSFGDLQTGPWLGTDGKGRDVLARIVWGSRTSIGAALVAALASLVLGVAWGAIAGLKGGRTDELMMRVVDALQSLPFIFVVIFLVTILDSWKSVLQARFGIDREVLFYVAIGAVYWLTMARVVRGQVLALRQAEFVQAARAMGASTAWIVRVHVVPNVLSVVIVYLTLTIPSVMLFEAFLSFLGLGVEPPRVSWGLLAADGAEAINPLRIPWWLVAGPAIAMGSTLLALNVLGDGLRDALDPRERGRR